MKIFDISVPIKNTMAVWPGDPKVKNIEVSSISNGGEANVTSIQMSAHTGTHIDAPRHFVDNGRTIDQLDLRLLIGDVLLLEIDDLVKLIDEKVLAGQRIKNWPTRVLFKTANSSAKLLHKEEFVQDFVAFSVDASQFLINHGVKLVGIDYLSIAPFENGDETHTILLSNEIIVLEGLDLSKIDPGYYQMVALPINLFGADGAPARVVLIQSD